MPTNYGSQNVRVSTGLMNTVDDEFCGGGSLAPGFASGQLGMKVMLGTNEIKFSAAVGTLRAGTYQYVQTFSGDLVLPARGLLAFWRDRINYLVTTSDAVGTAVAGVFINPITRGRYGFIQALQGGSVDVRNSVVCAIGDILFVNQGAGTAVAASATVGAITAAQLALRIGKTMAITAAGFTLTALDSQEVI